MANIETKHFYVHGYFFGNNPECEIHLDQLGFEFYGRIFPAEGTGAGFTGCMFDILFGTTTLVEVQMDAETISFILVPEEEETAIHCRLRAVDLYPNIWTGEYQEDVKEGGVSGIINCTIIEVPPQLSQRDFLHD